MSLKKIGIFQLFLLTTFQIFFLSCNSKLKNEKAIRKVFEVYTTSIINEDYAKAVDCLDSRSVAYNEYLLNNIKNSDSLFLNTLSIMDRISILLVRTIATKSEINSFDGKSIYEWMLMKGFVDKSDVANSSIGEISIINNIAQGELINENIKKMILNKELMKENIPKITFYFENNKWKFNTISIQIIAEPLFNKMATESGLDENTFILKAIQLNTGIFPNKEVWKPIQ